MTTPRPISLLVERNEQRAIETRNAALSEWQSRSMGETPDRYSMPIQMLLPELRRLRVGSPRRTIIDAWKAAMARRRR